MGNQFTRFMNEEYYNNNKNRYEDNKKEQKYNNKIITPYRNNANNYQNDKKFKNEEKENLSSKNDKNNEVMIYINEEVFKAVPIQQCDRENSDNLSSVECICYQVDLQQQCGKYVQSVVDQFVSLDVYLIDNRFCDKSTEPLSKKLFVMDTHCLVQDKDYVRIYPSALYWKQLKEVSDPYPNAIEFELVISHHQIKKKEAIFENKKGKKINNVKRNYDIDDISETNIFQQKNKINEKKESNNKKYIKTNNEIKQNTKDRRKNENNSSLKDTMKETTTENNKKDIKIEGEVDRISFRIGPKTTHVDIPVNKLHLDHLFQQILIENKIHISVLHDGEVIHDMHSWKMEGLMLFICEDEKKQEQVNEVCELNPFSGLQ